MSDEIEDAFSDLSPNYPGSNQTRRSIADQVVVGPSDDEAWDARPRFMEHDGKKVEFFLIGAVSKALNRSPITIRKWIKTGVLPKTRFISQGATFKPEGTRRLWTRAQIEGLIRIAQEEKIDTIPIGSTKFTERSFELFRALRGSE